MLEEHQQQEAVFVMNIVILGCGRVGALLATQLDNAGHAVTIVDSSSESFQRLDPEYKGDKVTGNGVDEEVLRRAHIQNADAFIAVTNGDNRNIMASQMAKQLFKVNKVLCRIYDPLRESTYRELGLETFCPTLVGANLLFNQVSGKPQANIVPNVKG
jgi:trk system potassium uptake protein TrkA